jgi:hypothetical protein
MIASGRQPAFVTVAAAVLVLASSGLSRADVLVFVSGRTMAVKETRVFDDRITVTLLQGGEATFSRSLIAGITKDETPEPPAVPVSASGSETPGPAGQRSTGPRPFAALIDVVARKHGLDPALVHAVVEAESGYRPSARSEAGARGLMQVLPSTARELGVRRAGALFDPEQNLDAGVRYLKLLLQQYGGDVRTALAAYNAGPGAVAKYDGIPPYPETRNYVRKVLSNLQP